MDHRAGVSGGRWVLWFMPQTGPRKPHGDPRHTGPVCCLLCDREAISQTGKVSPQLLPPESWHHLGASTAKKPLLSRKSHNPQAATVAPCLLQSPCRSRHTAARLPAPSPPCLPQKSQAPLLQGSPGETAKGGLASLFPLSRTFTWAGSHSVPGFGTIEEEACRSEGLCEGKTTDSHPTTVGKPSG